MGATNSNTGPLIGAAGNAASGLFGIVSTIINNKANRRLAMDTYNLQRKHALEDWQRQVDYESPAAQMARYKAAGINPNMVYGNQANSPTVRSTPMDTPQLQPLPSPDFGGAIMQYQQIKQQQAQTELTERSILLAEQRERMNQIKMIGDIIANDASAFTLEQKRKLSSTVYDTALANLETIQKNNQLKDQTFRQNQVMNPLRVQQLAAQISNTNAGTAKALQEVVVSKAMLPLKQKQALAAIDNMMQSTEGKILDNAYKRATQAERQTMLQYQMELVGGMLSLQETQKAQEQLKKLLLDNQVDMQGVNNVLNSLEKIKNIINPFSRSGGGEVITTSQEDLLDDGGAIRGTKVKTSTTRKR